MLFDVTALVLTSAALGHAAEASVAPASSSIVATLNTGSAVPPITITPASSAVDPGSIGHGIPVSTFEVHPTNPAQLRTLSGITLIRAFAGLSPAAIDKIVTSDPGIIQKVLDAPPSAKDASALWASFTQETRSKLITSAPRLVGNLSGLPVSVRDDANRLWVSRSITDLKSKLADVDGRAVAESDIQTLQTLTRVLAEVKTTKHGPARELLSVDPAGEGKAVIVLGNLQTANYVTYMVPGMFYTVDGQLGAWTGDAADLYSLQKKWLSRLAAQNPADAGKSVAVVAWMGYETPNLTNVGSLDAADQARDALARDIEAMQTQRAGNQPYTTIVAHSYGSTAALMALTQYDFSVNALVLVGTPGSPAQSAKDLHVKNTNVWVGSAAWDPVPTSAFFGSDPSAPSYDAHTMGVAGGTDVITGQTLAQSLGHNEYFDPNTESIRNMALIGIDQSELVMRGDAADEGRTLALARIGRVERVERVDRVG
ncbi:MAG TPA: alpha/beta fold hydrolase [Galbitalea sp.]|nr:alpha/beta fold hydrolase [Galbitalea sp.]